MEMHLVHQNASGGLGVIGVLFEVGAENEFLTKFWDWLPRSTGVVESQLHIDVSDVLPEAGVYAFDGSLTTPPCSEGVAWYLMKKPVTASQEQIDFFSSIFGNNARDAQPLNGRTVRES